MEIYKLYRRKGEGDMQPRANKVNEVFAGSLGLSQQDGCKMKE